jgi:hypothetical protein
MQRGIYHAHYAADEAVRDPPQEQRAPSRWVVQVQAGAALLVWYVQINTGDASPVR